MIRIPRAAIPLLIALLAAALLLGFALDTSVNGGRIVTSIDDWAQLGFAEVDLEGLEGMELADIMEREDFPEICKYWTIRAFLDNDFFMLEMLSRAPESSLYSYSTLEFGDYSITRKRNDMGGYDVLLDIDVLASEVDYFPVGRNILIAEYRRYADEWLVCCLIQQFDAPLVFPHSDLSPACAALYELFSCGMTQVTDYESIAQEQLLSYNSDIIRYLTQTKSKNPTNFGAMSR